MTLGKREDSSTSKSTITYWCAPGGRCCDLLSESNQGGRAPAVSSNATPAPGCRRRREAVLDAQWLDQHGLRPIVVFEPVGRRGQREQMRADLRVYPRVPRRAASAEGPILTEDPTSSREAERASGLRERLPHVRRSPRRASARRSSKRLLRLAGARDCLGHGQTRHWL